MSRAPDAWSAVAEELDRWQQSGRTARLWLRDDDAIEPTPALGELRALCHAGGIAVLLAVIPLNARPALVSDVAGDPFVEIAMHGIRHLNHAPADRRSEELTAERGRADSLATLVAARARLEALFGGRAITTYVPPWNRISAEVAGWLPAAGFTALSTFGAAPLPLTPALRQVNAHVDIIDWKGGRGGRSPDWTAAELARQLGAARLDGGRPVGILTHHLAHDTAAWRALDGIITATRNHAAAEWVRPSTLLGPAAASP